MSTASKDQRVSWLWSVLVAVTTTGPVVPGVKGAALTVPLVIWMFLISLRPLPES